MNNRVLSRIPKRKEATQPQSLNRTLELLNYCMDLITITRFGPGGGGGYCTICSCNCDRDSLFRTADATSLVPFRTVIYLEEPIQMIHQGTGLN